MSEIINTVNLYPWSLKAKKKIPSVAICHIYLLSDLATWLLALFMFTQSLQLNSRQNYLIVNNLYVYSCWNYLQVDDGVRSTPLHRVQL